MTRRWRELGGVGADVGRWQGAICSRRRGALLAVVRLDSLIVCSGIVSSSRVVDCRVSLEGGDSAADGRALASRRVFVTPHRMRQSVCAPLALPDAELD